MKIFSSWIYYFFKTKSEKFPIQVTEQLYAIKSIKDTIHFSMLASPRDQGNSFEVRKYDEETIL